ncbi:MAG TPA: dTDP-glucose 4,6-dehydratase [Candidatus Caccenecus avistercoris]|nr:dTDP-glucose 4,6-dehydratase [Candidatus Caccenecus avistercoris]
MKFVITGGAGFIGSNYLHYVVNKYPDDEFICIDALTYAGNYNNIKDLSSMSNFKFIKANICDREKIIDIFKQEKPDYIINFAAESHVDNSIKNPNLFVETNIIGTMNLMNAARIIQDEGIHKIKRFHQVSTDEVYGDLPLDRPDLLFTENTPIHTSSPYSASKAGADLQVLAYARTYKLPVTISRCSNNYGPYQFPEKLIPVVISKALKDEPIPVYGTGENIRDWIHVYDHNVGIDLIVRNGKEGNIYNLGGHSEKTNLELVKIILKELNKPESLITFVTDRPGHDLRYAIDSTKVEKELGWTRTYSFEEGIKSTIEWYVQNQEWIDDIKSGKYKYSYEDNNEKE